MGTIIYHLSSIMDLLNELPTLVPEAAFSKRIQTSVYCESVIHTDLSSNPSNPSNSSNSSNPVEPKTAGQSFLGTAEGPRPFRSPIQCLVAEYDEMYPGLPVKDRALYLKQQLHEIVTKIDEDRKGSFLDFGFNEKRLKPRVVQNALLSASGPPYASALSGLVYLNELYKIHVILVIKGCLYETTPKPYPPVYLEVNPGRYKIISDSLISPEMLGQQNRLSPDALGDTELEADVSGHLYRTPLKPASSYKAPELKELCKEHSISLTNSNGKAKVKGVLYDDLYWQIVAQVAQPDQPL